jgi:ribosomal protein S18 acetylase RimI-like enzyme
MADATAGDVLLWRRLTDLPPLGPLPEGYSRRSWLPGDEERLPKLLGEAFGPHRGTYAALEAFWRRFPGLGPEGAILIESSSGEIVATASARVDPGDAKRAWIHLVAAHAAHSRRGLATHAVVAALHAQADSGADTAWVGTGAHRLAAIGLYRRLGFETRDPRMHTNTSD